MTILNGSFEDQATGIEPGNANGWSVTETSTALDYAEFVVSILGAGTLTGACEEFEGEWPPGYSTGLVHGFVGYYSDLDPVAFNSTAGAPSRYENFETLWSLGAQGVFYFDHIVGEFFAVDVTEASGSEPVEDFDEGWPAGTLFHGAFEPSDLTVAVFDSAGTSETVEDFEELWNNVYNWEFPASGAGSELTFAVFFIAFMVTDTIESFNVLKPDLGEVAADPATDTFTCLSHGLSDLWRITFRNEDGQLPEGVYANMRYFVQNKTTDTFQVSWTISGSPISIGDFGSGEHFVVHDDRSFWVTELDS